MYQVTIGIPNNEFCEYVTEEGGCGFLKFPLLLVSYCSRYNKLISDDGLMLLRCKDCVKEFPIATKKEQMKVFQND